MIGVSAISELPISALPAAFLTPGEQSVTALYASHSFVTRGTDSPAHRFIPGRIAKGLQLTRAITRGEAGTFGSLIETKFGEIELNNAGGALDSLIDDFTADGRAIRLYIGATEIDTAGRERVQAFADFELVYTARAGSWSLEHDVLRLRVRDLGIRLRDRIQIQTYSGGGGATGTAELAGRTMPLAFGHCKNVTAQLVDPLILMYQVHAGSMQEFIAVYDKAIEVTGFFGDFPTYDALAAATLVGSPVEQGYATCLATGHFRLATPPLGRVTADIRGDKDNTTGNHVTTHGSVIRMILRDYGNILSADIDHTSFNDFTANNPSAVMGLFLPAGDESTTEEVVARIALSCGAVVGQDRSGLYRIFLLDEPALAQHWSFDDRDIIRIEREEPDYSIPFKSWQVGYDVNWTVQDSGELAGGLTDARRQFVEHEFRFALTQDPAIASAHATSTGAPTRKSLFRDEDDAQAETERLIGLYARGRALYRFAVKNALFSVELGQTVRLTYPRWNLAQGKHFVVVAVHDDADAIETEILVFG